MEGYVLDESAVARLKKLLIAFETGQFAPPVLSGGVFPRLPERNFVRQLFVNKCGATFPAYGVGMVDDREPIDTIEYLDIKKPDNKLKRRYLVNGSDDVADGASGWGTWLWHSDYVLYDPNDGTPAKDEEWGVATDSFKLKKGRCGFLITGGTAGDSETGDQRVKAIQLPLIQVLCKNSSTINFGDIANANVFGGDPASLADTGMIVENANNKYGRNVAANKVFVVTWFNGHPYVAPYECF